MKNRKRLKAIVWMVVISCLIISVAAFYRPKTFNSLIDRVDGDCVAVSYVRDKLDGNIPEADIENFQIFSESAEYQEIENVFRKYSYHNSLDTLSSIVKGQASSSALESLFLSFVVDGRLVQVLITNSSLIWINAVVYRTDYLGDRKGNTMLSELKEVLGVG